MSNGYSSPSVEPYRRHKLTTMDLPSSTGSGLVAQLDIDAKECAKKALDAAGNGKIFEYAVFAGIAVELAMKRHLASASPVLLAGRNSSEHMVALARPNKEDPSDLWKHVTIVGAELIDRYLCLCPQQKGGVEKSIKNVMGYRNRAVHTGRPPAPPFERMVEDFLFVFTRVLDADDSTWQGDYASFITTALRNDAERFEMNVELRVATSRANFAGFQDNTALIGAIAILNAQRPDTEEGDVYPTVCPACQQKAWLYGTNELEWDLFDKHEGPEPYVTFTPERMRCDVCGLTLNDFRELRCLDLDGPRKNNDNEILQDLLEEESEMREYDEDYYESWGDELPYDEDLAAGRIGR
jgi:hypothetical protein